MLGAFQLQHLLCTSSSDFTACQREIEPDLNNNQFWERQRSIELMKTFKKDKATSFEHLETLRFHTQNTNQKHFTVGEVILMKDENGRVTI